MDLEAGRGDRSIGQLLREEQARILMAWESAVRDLPPAGNLPGRVLRDEIPEVLESIAALVDAPRELEARARESPERHAIERLGVGFEIAHVLLEYSVLRECIFEALAEHTRLSIAELLVVNRAIDEVANRSVERFSEASERLLKALDRVSAEALASRSLDELLHRILTVILQASGSIHSAAILLKGDDGRLHMRGAVGLIAERDPAFSLAIGEGFSGTVAARREPLLSRSAENDPRVKSDFIRLRHVQALYGVPLVEQDLIGVAHMGSLTVHDFTNEEKLLFQAIAHRATAAIAQSQLLERERRVRQDAERFADQLAVEHRLFVATLEQMPVGVVLYDLTEHQITASNLAIERILGFKPRCGALFEEGLARYFFHPDGRRYPSSELPLARAARGEEVRQEEIRFLRPQGDWIDLQVSAAPIHADGGRMLAAVLVVEDVTARKQSEAERELFLGTLSHDLRNPLSVITVSAASLLERGVAPQDAAGIRRIERTAERMDRLIEQLLDFARSRHGGGIPLTRRPVDLVALTRQVIDSLSITHPGHAVRLEAPSTLRGSWDPERLVQVVQNLVVNAFEHGRPDAPVEVRLSQDGDATLAVTSRNRQGAIPDDLLAHLFDPFRRGVAPGGVGLGLYICHQIVRAHGGDIEVRSNDQTTTFRVRLPLAAPSP